MDYIRIYEDTGNRRDSIGGMHIPIFSCGKSFGDGYARSVSYGISKIFSLSAKSRKETSEEVYSYLVAVCEGKASDEDCHDIYDKVMRGLASKTISVYALSYKHRMRGGPLGLRQRLSPEMMEIMATEIVSHAVSSGSQMFCFWLDQILGQRQPYAERRWVDNGLLPYAVFDTIVFDYAASDVGAWLTAEKLLASGRSNSSSRKQSSTLIQRGATEGGPDSLMRAASALACGVIDDLRGDLDDKRSIVRWSLETLDMSQYMKGNQVEHFTRLFQVRKPWNRTRLSSVMCNLEILPGELSRTSYLRGPASWEQEAALLSSLIPSDLRPLCDGSWLSRGVTRIHATGLPNRFLFVQVIRRSTRPPLLIAAIVTGPANAKSNQVEKYMAATFNNDTDPHAQQVSQKSLEIIEWRPLARFLKSNDLMPAELIKELSESGFALLVRDLVNRLGRTL